MDNNNNETPDYLSMSDEDIAKLNVPAVTADTTTPSVVEATETGADEGGDAGAATTTTEVADGAAVGSAAGEEGAESGDGDKPATGEDGTTQTPPAAATPDSKTEPAKQGEEGKDADKPVVTATTEVPTVKALADYTAEDKAAAFDRLMAPFKANGREIKLESPEEAIKLQQMGANYTKKMQALQPALRIIKMLENNQLMDETRLAHLIDISKGDSGAIQKLLVDSKFDPMSADAEKAAGYVPGNHQVSDNELAFQAVLDEVEATPTGLETIAEVAKQWDADSKRVLFEDPALLSVINVQRANGIYGRITAEVERQRTLGNLQGLPFLQAYKAVGDALQAQGQLAPTPPKRDPVATRTVVPATTVSNNDRAKAASSIKATPATAKVDINPLDLSDDEFLKQMAGRV